MCGVAGLIDGRLIGNQRALEANARAMADAIAHRGPDGSAVWCDPEMGIALSHRRLAVIDLSPAGAQPMVSSDGRWVISYNGEVYNAGTIARSPELLGVRFRGTCDTEIVVESVARRGLDRTVADLNGMFAILLWDRAERTMHLVRDRVGIKPLFYAIVEGAIWFASELKSFAAVTGLRLEIDPASIASYLRFGHVPAPWSIFKGVSKVMPGEIVSVRPRGVVTRRRYWSLSQVAAAGLSRPFEGTDTDAEAALHDLLADAVSSQMASDVPLGALLSGGVDSSVVTAMMAATAPRQIRTFSVGFDDPSLDEAKYAAAVARHLGTNHTELTATGAEALAVVPMLPDLYDEPFADSSQIPTYLVSKLARGYVTVALSGDGGDELFAGYDRYARAENLYAVLACLPVSWRRTAANVLRAIPDIDVGRLSRRNARRTLSLYLVDKAKRLAEILPHDRDALYLHLISLCRNPAVFNHGVGEHPLNFEHYSGLIDSAGYTARMQLLDTATYLPDDILQKVDRASMSVALEVRPPLIDHRIVELTWRLPRRFHVRNGETKWLLRRVLDRYVPRGLVDRPKKGFVVPLGDWLRGPLRDWAEDLFEPTRFGGEFLDAEPARHLWALHLDQRRNYANELWPLLMFEAWRRRWTQS